MLKTFLCFFSNSFVWCKSFANSDFLLIGIGHSTQKLADYNMLEVDEPVTIESMYFTISQ